MARKTEREKVIYVGERAGECVFFVDFLSDSHFKVIVKKSSGIQLSVGDYYLGVFERNFLGNVKELIIYKVVSADRWEVAHTFRARWPWDKKRKLKCSSRQG